MRNIDIPLLSELSHWIRKPTTNLLIIVVWLITANIAENGIINFVFVVVLLLCSIGHFFAFLGFVATKEKLNHHFVALIIPLLILTNLEKLDYAGTYLTVRIFEPHLLRKAEVSYIQHSDPNSSFKYFRVSFGQFVATKRWLVYDESGQVSLDYMKRSAEWWQVSKEKPWGSCTPNGKRLYANFFVQYLGDNCY